jgi:hypothetical protein
MIRDSMEKEITITPILIQGEEKIRPLGQGPALLLITLTNTPGNEVLRKTTEFK